MAIAYFFPSLFFFSSFFSVFFAVIPYVHLPRAPIDAKRCVSSVLQRTLRPRSRRMCVIAKETEVSTGSHTQDIDLSKAPPHLRAPIRLVDTVRVRKPRSPQMAITPS